MIEYIFNWIVVPGVISWGLTNFFWRRLNRKEAAKPSRDKIKSLISTEEQGEFVNVSFLMEDDSVRNFRVTWLPLTMVASEVLDLESWEILFLSPLGEAARHAATLHHKGGGKTNKNVYDSNQDWRLM